MTNERLRIERLAGLCRIWGAAKFFHPYLAYRDIDWDAALVAAIPMVSSADSVDDYAAAIGGLLEGLGDPATRVLSKEELDDKGADLAPDTKLAEERSLLWRDGTVALKATALGGLMPGLELTATTERWFKEMEAAELVVFDLRRGGLYWAAMQQLEELSVRLLDGEAVHPATRTRQHSGYVAGGDGPAFYSSGFYVTDHHTVRGTGGPLAAKPLAFVLDWTVQSPNWVLALQSAGRARVVYVGAPEVRAAGELVQLPDGVSVVLRTSEQVSPDGRVGFSPDVVLAEDTEAADYFDTTALQAALSPATPRPDRETSAGGGGPGVVYRGEKGYEDTPYPDKEHRLLALFRYWTVMDLFFPYQQHLDQPWDEVLLEGIPSLEAAADETEYVLALAEVNAKSSDTHCVFYAPAFQRWMGTHSPEMKVRLVEGRSLITHVADAIQGVAVGDVVISVDGESAEALRDRRRPYIAASTPQAMEWRLHNALLSGAEDTQAVLELETADGGRRTVEVPRTHTYVLPPELKGPTFGVLPSGLGYFDLARLMVDHVDDAFDAVRETPALIIDDRCYPNGTAWSIAPRLATGDFVGALFGRPERRSPSRDELTRNEFRQRLPGTDKWRYDKPVAVLINGEAISQAEHTCLLIDAACKPTFIGSATNGANGDVTRIQLPGGIRTMFSGHDVRHADGRQLQRVGILPDIEVHPTIAGIREGRDEVLEAAIAFLTKR